MKVQGWQVIQVECRAQQTSRNTPMCYNRLSPVTWGVAFLVPTFVRITRQRLIRFHQTQFNSRLCGGFLLWRLPAVVKIGAANAVGRLTPARHMNLLFR